VPAQRLDLGEGALVEQDVQPLVDGQLALGVLSLGGGGSGAEPRLLVAFAQRLNRVVISEAPVVSVQYDQAGRKRLRRSKAGGGLSRP